MVVSLAPRKSDEFDSHRLHHASILYYTAKYNAHFYNCSLRMVIMGFMIYLGKTSGGRPGVNSSNLFGYTIGENNGLEI